MARVQGESHAFRIMCATAVLLALGLVACGDPPGAALVGAGAASGDALAVGDGSAVDTAGAATADGLDAAAADDLTGTDASEDGNADAAQDSTADNGSPGGPCKSNDDCPAAAKICDPLPGKCAACLFDGDCASGQRCVSRTCVAYTTCANSLACKDAKGPGGKDQAICDPAKGECVACVADADCPQGQMCHKNNCLAVTICINSTQCPPDKVCDPKLGQCFACVADMDCPANHLCQDHVCQAYVSCASDKQCTPMGQLCDSAKGKCAGCLKNEDCPGVYHCGPSGVGGTGSCEIDVCQPGQGSCTPAGKVVCTAAGDGFSPPQACPPASTCAVQLNVPNCVPWVCQPGKHCAGQTVVECSADGLTLQKSTDCAATGQKCLGDACKSTLCDPGQKYCQGNAVLSCSADGMVATPVKTCLASEYCLGGTCKPQVCPPGKPVCSGNVVKQCNANGSATEGVAQDCGSLFCVAGACVALKCAPGNLYCIGNQVAKCSTDGQSNTLGAVCGSNQVCEFGLCKAVVCTSNQLVCKGNYVASCNAAGSGFTLTGTDCGLAGQSCKGGACVKASCGDGIVNAPIEQCDDGNSTASDGCSATCQLESTAAGTAALTLPAGAACKSTCPAAPSCSAEDGCGKPCPPCTSSPGKLNTCQAGSCAACVPSCAPGQCGTDGCGGWCTPCNGSQSCNGKACVAACSLCPTGGCAVLNFENGLLGWDVTGDANVVPALGKAVAPSGTGMLRLSTGLATNVSTNARTALCVPAGSTKIRFKWQFLSEEFMEYCDSQYQDNFTVQVLTAGGSTTAFSVKIKDICTNAAYSKYLVQADVVFDQSGVYTTGWFETTVAVPNLAAATQLVLAVSDVGDSIFDTVVLVDDIAFLP